MSAGAPSGPTVVEVAGRGWGWVIRSVVGLVPVGLVGVIAALGRLENVVSFGPLVQFVGMFTVVATAISLVLLPLQRHLLAASLEGDHIIVRPFRARTSKVYRVALADADVGVSGVVLGHRLLAVRGPDRTFYMFVSRDQWRIDPGEFHRRVGAVT